MCGEAPGQPGASLSVGKAEVETSSRVAGTIKAIPAGLCLPVSFSGRLFPEELFTGQIEQPGNESKLC